MIDENFDKILIFQVKNSRFLFLDIPTGRKDVYCDGLSELIFVQKCNFHTVSRKMGIPERSTMSLLMIRL